MRLLASVRSVVSAVVHHRQTENDLEEELRGHLQDRVNDLVGSGLSRSEAERRARLEFGGYQKFKEECHEALGAHFVETLEDPAIIGKDVTLNGIPFTIVGVTPRNF